VSGRVFVTKGIQRILTVGVPYTDDQISKASEEVKGKSEMDAVVAYLQVLGTLAK